VVGGVAEGEAFVTRDTVSGWGGIDHLTGTIVEMRHEKRGQSFAGKVLVFPGAKGSSGWSHYFHMARIAGVAPKAMVFNVMTTKVALGAVVVRAPAVTDLDRDPLDRRRRLGEGGWRQRHRRGDEAVRLDPPEPSETNRKPPAKCARGAPARCVADRRRAMTEGCKRPGPGPPAAQDQ
jgi:predicted aconitase with swiveling domain